MLERWWQDVRLALTTLSRARGFSAVAIATLAIGVAGVTVMFTLVVGVQNREISQPPVSALCFMLFLVSCTISLRPRRYDAV